MIGISTEENKHSLFALFSLDQDMVSCKYT